MIIVNPTFIEKYLIPMIGGGDREEDEDVIQMSRYDLDREQDRIELIKRFLLPEFEKEIDLIKKVAKDSLAYYLWTNKLNFEGVLDSILTPVRYSHDVRPFFEQLWELAFPSEKYEYIKDQVVREEYDVEATSKLYLQHREKERRWDFISRMRKFFIRG